VTFEEILDQAFDMLWRRGRVTYGTLKRHLPLMMPMRQTSKTPCSMPTPALWMTRAEACAGQASRSPRRNGHSRMRGDFTESGRPLAGARTPAA